MKPITIDELTQMLRDGSGVDESVDLSGDIADMSFSELGYDSLAVLELMGEIERVYDVTIPDEAVSRIGTPRQAADYINELLLAAS